MPLRWNDPALWCSLPGVIAVYQPIAAPDALSARRNMARRGDGRYGADPGVVPGWSKVSGWTFDGVTQYLSTGIIPDSGYSHLIQYTGSTGTGFFCGTTNAYSYFVYRLRANDGGVPGNVLYGVQNEVSRAPSLVAGNLGVAGYQPYRNGLADGAEITSSVWSATQNLYLGGVNLVNSLNGPGAFTLVAYAIYDRTLSAAEMWLASQQMAYCHINPAWNVWSPQRRWFFIPPPPPATATPALATIYINTGDIGDTSLFDDVSGATVSSTYARTGTNSFKLDGTDYLQANLTSSATKYSKFGLLVTATPAADALLCAWQEDGTEHVSLYLTDKLTLQMRQGSTIIQTSPTTLEVDTWYCVETKIVVHTTTGRFQVRIDGVDDMEAIGINTDADVDGVINEIRFEAPVNDTYIDDIVVREDQWCGTGGVYVVVPTAAGTVEEWTGAYTDVDDLPPSFTDYIETTVESGSDQIFRHGGLSGDFDVGVVGVFAKGRLDASVDTVFYALAMASLENNVGYAQDLDTIGVYARVLMTMDPNGTVAWTTHAVNNALQIGVRA